MKIIEKLKADAMKERKAKGPLVGFYSLIISDIINVGKNDKGRETTEDEAIRVIKNMITKNEATIAVMEANGGVDTSELKAENWAIEGFVPEVMSENETFEAIVALGGTNIGQIMGGLKKVFGAKVDMKLAQRLAKEFLA